MDPSSPLPVPDSGLPPGWSLEQWDAYGHAWIKQQELEAQVEPVSTQVQIEPIYSAQTNIQQPMVMVQAPHQGSAGKALSTVAIIAICIVVIVVLAGFLYAWANSLASKEIEGTWKNPIDTIDFSRGGDASSSSSNLEEWRVSGDMLYLIFSDEPEYEYIYIYEVSGDFLFVAPYDYDDTVMSEECVMYSSNSAANTETYWDSIVVEPKIPTWCD